MAREHRMIEPFEPQQVKQNGSDRMVSYGTSSYGYDVRCADEFKIFTNINSTIVDPKKFDALTKAWCKLPEKERAKAMQEMTKDLPPKYREVIEGYFRRMAQTEKP